jgi:hypothetical protein
MRAQRWTGTGLKIAFALLAAGSGVAVQAQAPLLTKQAELTLERYGRFGSSAALSGDGRTAVLASQLPPDCSAPPSCPIGYVYARATNGTWSRQGTLDLPTPPGNDYFSPAVALSDDGGTALVGLQYRDCGAASDCGAAYVFVRAGAGWRLLQSLGGSGPAANDHFGAAVSLSGDGATALVTAPWKACNRVTLCGAAYVFTRNGSRFRQTARLAAADGRYHEFFGNAASLSRDGSTALLGAHSDRRHDAHCAGYSCGAAYVFVRQRSGSWTQKSKLTASDARPNDAFGYSVALSEDGGTAAIGQVGVGGSGVYLFERTGGGWAQDRKLTANPSKYFGFSVALSDSGDALLVGDIVGSSFCSGPGCRPARLFARSPAGWSEVQQLFGSDPQGGNSLFGQAVALSGSGRTALVGSAAQYCSAGPNAGQAECGAAYIFGAPGAP